MTLRVKANNEFSAYLLHYCITYCIIALLTALLTVLLGNVFATAVSAPIHTKKRPPVMGERFLGFI